MNTIIVTFRNVFSPSDPAEAIDEWQVVEETDVYPRIRISADTQQMELAIQQLRAGKTVQTLNLNQSLSVEQMAL